MKVKHHKAFLRNMVRNLVIRKQIKTTLRRAKVVSAYADGMVELAKRGDLHARRTLISRLGCADTAHTLITQIAPHFKERRGGYTRVLRVGMNRPGDGSEVAILEFTAAIEVPGKNKKPKKDKKAKAVQGEELQKPKKEKVKTPEKKEDSKASAEEKKGKADSKEKKESEKKGGFLGALRKFLKGDDESK